MSNITKKLLFFLCIIFGVLTITIVSLFENPPLHSNAYSPISPKALEGKEDKININTAVIEELTLLKGIGEVKAKAIIEYRTKNGNFISIADIKNVKGITEKIYDEIKDKIEV